VGNGVRRARGRSPSSLSLTLPLFLSLPLLRPLSKLPPSLNPFCPPPMLDPGQAGPVLAWVVERATPAPEGSAKNTPVIKFSGSPREAISPVGQSLTSATLIQAEARKPACKHA
jgi:hypothetical protein